MPTEDRPQVPPEPMERPRGSGKDPEFRKRLWIEERMSETWLVEEIAAILAEPGIESKLDRARELCRRGECSPRLSHEGPPVSISAPARPRAWQILTPLEIRERPRLTSPEGRYRLLHSVAHIEVSAVELALLAVADFPGEEESYYRDMLRVAGEEVEHAGLLGQRLRELGGELGSEPVHLGLWETARRYPDLTERLAVVPRILEARGLDVSGRLRIQLRAAGDPESAQILERIYQDEISHVAVGSRWFRRVCLRQEKDPEDCFLELWTRFRAERGGRIAALDREGRLAAGFTERELAGMVS